MTESAQESSSTVHRLLDYIHRHKLGEGSRLPSIKELAAEWRVGSQVVRDALLQAQTMGLVRVQARSGSYVQSVDFAPMVDVFARSLPHALAREDRNLFDLLEARRLIEVELTGMAAGRRRLADLVPLRNALRQMYANPNDYETYIAENESFHLSIARIAGNEVLTTVLHCLLMMLRPTLGEREPATWKEQGSEKRERDSREHEAIFEALLAGAAAAAKAAMTDHLRDTTESLIVQAADCKAR